MASSVKGLQGPKDERKRLRLRCSSNNSKTSSSMSVVSTLYTCCYFAGPDYCRSVFFVQWTLVRRNTVNGTAPASLSALYCEPGLRLQTCTLATCLVRPEANLAFLLQQHGMTDFGLQQHGTSALKFTCMKHTTRLTGLH